jgi:hypothetical protein
VHRPVPGPAIAAAVLAVLSATVPGLLVLVLLALYAGEAGAQEWLWLLVPAGLAVALVVGAVLLLLGRSWLALVVPAGAVVALVVAVFVLGDGGRLGPFAVLSVLVPLAAAVLGALPGVRQWVRDRRTPRPGPLPT